MAASSSRARVALVALPLVATVGVGSVVMSPTATEAPLASPSAGGGSAAPATALPLAPPVLGAPVTVLDLAATGGPVAADPIVPGRTARTTSTGRGAHATTRRTTRSGSAVPAGR